MKNHCFLIGMLVAASVCVDLVIVVAACSQDSWLSTREILAANGLALGQTVLAGIWIVWGTWKLPLRLLLAGVVIWGASSVTHAVTAANDFRIVLTSHLMFLAIVIGALAAARSLGVRFVAAHAHSIGRIGNPSYCAEADDETEKKTSPPWQYTLAQLLSWTTLIAIVLGTLLRVWDPRVDTGRLFTQALPFSILAIVVFFGAFQKQTLLAIILLLFAAPLFAVLPAWLEGGSAVGFWRDRLVVSISLTMYIIGAVAVIRTGGFRLRYTVGTQRSNRQESTEPNLVPFGSPHAGP